MHHNTWDIITIHYTSKKESPNFDMLKRLIWLEDMEEKLKSIIDTTFTEGKKQTTIQWGKIVMHLLSAHFAKILVIFALKDKTTSYPVLSVKLDPVQPIWWYSRRWNLQADTRLYQVKWMHSSECVAIKLCNLSKRCNKPVHLNIHAQTI